jgi:ABC-type polysaccharide/polyol phosphate export permease
MSSVVSPTPISSSRAGLLERLRQLYARRETIRYLTSSNLKAGHRDKVLGHLWNLLDPLMFMLVYYFVFGVLFKLAGGGRSVQLMLYILIGILTWRFIQSTIAQSANCIRGNRGLIHEINFPKAVFPISVTLSRLYDLVWGFCVLVTFLLVAGTWPTVHYLWLPILVALLILFVMGVAFVVAYLGAFFADTTNVINVALRLLFYCSPIFYYVRPKPGLPDDKVFLHGHELIYRIYMLNPIACFYECFRDALLWGDIPEPGLLLYAAAVSVGTCLVGFMVFVKGEGKFAKYV